VIEKNKQRFPKAIRAFHEQGEPVVVQGFPDTEEEYSYLCRQIGSLCEQEAEYSRVCCIYRTNGDMQKLARYLTKERIPFRMKEHCSSVFRHFIALDILSYLQFFREGQKRRDFLVIMNKPLRYLSRKACTSEEVSFQELRNYYRGKGYMQQSIHQLEMQKHWITRLDLYGAVSYIRKVVGYEDYLRKYAKDQGIVWEELEEILDFVHQSTRGINSIAAWKREIAEYEEALAQAGEEREGVWLMTMHACKGLEFPYVFLPDCNEGKTPHKKAVSRAEIEEERRMFYVAMTRAQKKLYILYLADKKKKKLLPSRFLPTIDFPLLR
jgi:DNA helicase-2/ATP-dependent DNA helicase PcrA